MNILKVGWIDDDTQLRRAEATNPLPLQVQKASVVPQVQVGTHLASWHRGSQLLLFKVATHTLAIHNSYTVISGGLAIEHHCGLAHMAVQQLTTSILSNN